MSENVDAPDEGIDEDEFDPEDPRLEAGQAEAVSHDNAPEGFEPDEDALADPDEPEVWNG